MSYPELSISRVMVFSISAKKRLPVPRTTTPMASERLLTRSRAELLGIYPEASTTARTLFRTSSLTSGRLFRTLETVLMPTPHCLAISLIVIALCRVSPDCRMQTSKMRAQQSVQSHSAGCAPPWSRYGSRSPWQDPLHKEQIHLRNR